MQEFQLGAPALWLMKNLAYPFSLISKLSNYCQNPPFLNQRNGGFLMISVFSNRFLTFF